VVDIRIADLCVDLSPDECWRLYVLLGDGAPFVRNQLSVIRHGGTGAVSLSTREERRQVLDALAAGSLGAGVLSTGLRSLQRALRKSDDPRQRARCSAPKGPQVSHLLDR
jgi:hypothetical protein